ncbi:uncharacterized protein KGF55_001414 [Candida pseudojiufengensis]|uniref:uncharacterized protein n=1 Tax=Candida pseudojiufengensis TaxID=497109 RepID=UPI0022243D3D|nr:uncharacterized protein KGF55_001414 [Candida pseudojiufengensis]KAI5965194.1 hypothetical protein KGF55_001414 [Candida pseudojiufengensis]
MPDLFDNFFTSIGAKFHNGQTKRRYSMGSQVNSGKFYSYHNTPSNNNYWLPRKSSTGEEKLVVSEDGKVKSVDDIKIGTAPIPVDESDKLNRSRFSSVSSDTS